jgi:hypothetical protein
MEIGSGIDVRAGGRRRARRAESVDLEPDARSRNPSQSLNQQPSLRAISEDTVRNGKRIDQRDSRSTIAIQMGSQPFGGLNISSQPRVVRILQ